MLLVLFRKYDTVCLSTVELSGSDNQPPTVSSHSKTCHLTHSLLLSLSLSLTPNLSSNSNRSLSFLSARHFLRAKRTNKQVLGYKYGRQKWITKKKQCFDPKMLIQSLKLCIKISVSFEIIFKLNTSLGFYWIFLSAFNAAAILICF